MLSKILILALTGGLAVKAYRSWLQKRGEEPVRRLSVKRPPALGAPAKSARAAKAVKAVKAVKAANPVNRLQRKPQETQDAQTPPVRRRGAIAKPAALPTPAAA